MEASHHHDARSFLDDAHRLLVEDRARHNLILGVVQTVLDQPDVYESFEGWVVTDRGVPVAAATRTVPWRLVLADATSPRALDALARSVVETAPDLPGVLGNEPFLTEFVEIWERLTGAGAEEEVRHGVFKLDKVTLPPRPPGSARPATRDDADVLVRWWQAFIDEADPGETLDPERAGELVDQRLDPRRPQSVWLWEDEEPVSMSGHSGPAFRGVRIGPVYTPPEHRGHGYATALVALQSRHLLENGHDFCYLYTDLANPTANAIYTSIGYEEVARSARVRFSSPSKKDS
ncbi:MAG: GNAT family N-acetyltransferase [Acidimicrobiia bacterium]